MYQIITKATNIITKDVLYEGVKKEYESYWQAARALKHAVQYSKNTLHRECSSYRVPENYNENIHAYVSWNHYGSSIRTTLYIKRVETD